MPRLAICPKCEENVAVPGPAIEETEVRCPLCEGDFKLSEAEVLELQELEITGGETATADDTGDWAPPAERLDAMPEGEGTAGFDFGSGASEDAPAAGFDPSASGSATATKTKPRKKAKKPGALSFIVGIVAFGILGIVLGYVILWFAWRERAHSLATEMGFMPVVVKVEQWIGVEGSDSLEEPEKNADGSFDFTPGGAFQNEPSDEPAEPRVDETPVEPVEPVTDETAEVVEEPEPVVETPDWRPRVALAKFNLAQINEALADIVDEMERVREDSRQRIEAGEDDVPDPERLTISLYKKLCAAGHRITWIDQATPEERDAAQAQVDNVLMPIVMAKTNRTLIHKSSGKWLYGNVRPIRERGVVLAGTVSTVREVGDLYESEIQLSDGKQVVVLSGIRPEFHATDDVVIFGSILKSEEYNTIPYSSDEPLIVLSGISHRL